MLNLQKENLQVRQNWKFSSSNKTRGFLYLVFLFSTGIIFAQSEIEKDSLWTKGGTINVLFNQANFGEWLGGGTNSFNGIVNLDYELHRLEEKWDWTTTFDASLGFSKTESSNFYKKTVDHFELNSVFIRKKTSPWSFSTSTNIKSQWVAGYEFSEGSTGEEIKNKTTAFFSPLYARIGVGITYKKTRSFSLQIEPVTARLIYVGSQFTDNLATGETFFGVAPNEQTRFEMGLSIAAQGKWPLFPNVILNNKINLISNYLKQFKNFDLDYTMGIDMKINNFMSAQFELQLLYDDNAIAKIQTRQVFGVSFGFSI